MKRIVCIVVLACLVFSVAFAQQKQPAPAPAKPAAAPEPTTDKQNAFGVDLFQLVKGFIASSDDDTKLSVFIISAGYEKLVSSHFSIGVDVDMYFTTITFKIPNIATGGTDSKSIDSKYFSIAAEGRYYPSSQNFEKFFVGATLGYNMLEVDGKKKPENGGFEGLSTSLKIGYKIITKNNLFIEPSMSYVLSKSGGGEGAVGALFGIPTIPTPNGWNGGVRLGLLF